MSEAIGIPGSLIAGTAALWFTNRPLFRLHVLAKKDVRIPWTYYVHAGIVRTLPVLFVTLSGLWIALSPVR